MNNVLYEAIHFAIGTIISELFDISLCLFTLNTALVGLMAKFGIKTATPCQTRSLYPCISSLAVKSTDTKRT